MPPLLNLRGSKMTISKKTISLDLETYSSADLPQTGATKYAAAPDFEILLLAWAEGDGPVELFDFQVKNHDKLSLYRFLSQKLLEGCTFSAYNANFEWTCLCAWLHDLATPAWKEQLLGAFTCTMAQAAYCGLPIGLSATGRALGLPADKQKLAIGKKLIDVFCKPSKKALAGARVLPAQEPEKWALFTDYCRHDVEAERAIQRALHLHPMPDEEQALWRNTCRMNARGVAVDLDLVQGAIAITEADNARLRAEGQALGVDNPNSLTQLKAAVNAALGGVEEITTLRKADVETLLEKYPENGTLQALLHNRLAGGKSSLAKYPAILTAQLHGRVHDQTLFYGASRTGRFAGRGVQPQNLPRNYLKHLGLAREVTKTGNLELLRLVFGPVQDTLSQLIRTAFIPAPGHCFLVADFSAIEARVIAWLAGEDWVNHVFAGDGRIYEATASQMFGVPIDRIRPGLPEYTLRQKGKIATLALGYAGGTGALVAMGALKMGLTENELPDIVGRWRSANPHIVQLWQDVEDAALSCVTYCQKRQAKGIAFSMEQVNGTTALTLQLPSDRKLYYLAPQIIEGGKFNQPSLHYLDAKSGGAMVLAPTFGGKLAENCVQAIARDCLAVTLLRLEALNYRTVLHVHDEVIIEAPESADLQPVLDVMAEPIPWAPGLVLRGAGFKTTDYYMKD